MKAYRWRWISILGILAALWAALELSLGTTLYLLRVPFRGELFIFLTLPLMFVTRYLVPRRGSVAALGIITGTVRWLLGGAFAPLISLAIAIEALLVELGLGSVCDGSIPPRWRTALAGALPMGYTAVHPVFFWGLLMGGGRGIELPAGWHGYMIFGSILALHMLVGGAAGIWARSVLKKLPLQALQPVNLQKTTSDEV